MENLIKDAEKLLSNLIEEAKRMDQYVDEEKKVAYRQFKEKQVITLTEIIQALKETEVETVYLPIQSEEHITYKDSKPVHISDMSIRKIHGIHGKEVARAESIKRANDFMDYQAEVYGLKSKQ